MRSMNAVISSYCSWVRTPSDVGSRSSTADCCIAQSWRAATSAISISSSGSQMSAPWALCSAPEPLTSSSKVWTQLPPARKPAVSASPHWARRSSMCSCTLALRTISRAAVARRICSDRASRSSATRTARSACAA